MKRMKTRYIPSDLPNKIEKSELNSAVVYWGEKYGKFFVMGFQGKRKNHDFYYQFSGREEMMKSIERFFAGIKKTIERKKRIKEENKGKLSSHAAAAKAIRELLKKDFPATKFQVKSKTFAGGNSVDVFWIDGPTEKQVNEKIGQFQYGHFDGTQDLYCYSNRRKDIPQVRFVSTSRHLSYEKAMIIVQEIERKFAEKIKIEKNEAWSYIVIDDHWRNNFNCYGSNLLYRESVDRSF